MTSGGPGGVFTVWWSLALASCGPTVAAGPGTMVAPPRCSTNGVQIRSILCGLNWVFGRVRWLPIMGLLTRLGRLVTWLILLLIRCVRPRVRLIGRRCRWVLISCVLRLCRLGRLILVIPSLRMLLGMCGRLRVVFLFG